MSLLTIIKLSTKKHSKQSVRWLENACEKKGFRQIVFVTTGEYERDCAAIKQMLRHITQVVVIGGDGTLHLAVNALMGSDCTLALLPCGTGNDFSRGFDCGLRDWQQAVFNSATAIDIGQINSRYFINIAGVGFDAHVVNVLKGKVDLLPFSYRWTSFKELFYYQPQLLTGIFSKNTEQYTNLITVFANHRYFGGGLELAPYASLIDAQLECYQMRSDGLFCNMVSFIKLLLKRNTSIRNLTYNRLSTASIMTKGLLIEADGELVGKTPAVISVHAQALFFHMPIKKRLQ